MRIKFIFPFILFAFLIFFLSLQSSLFDTFNLEAEKDIFLEFEVDTSLQYNLFVIDSYNSSSFGIKYTLEYAIVSIYKKDKKTAYPSSIYVSPFKEGGITTSEKEAVASFKPLESIIYVRVRGTSIKSSGTFGLALLNSKNKKASFKLSKSIFSDLHKEAINKYALEQYKLVDGKALKFTYSVEKGSEYKLTLVDSFNNELFGTYFTLDGLWFHIMDENNNIYDGVYSSIAEDGGITPLNSQFCAKFIAKSQTINILIEPLSLVYEGTFGIKLEKDNTIIKPKNVSEAEPIGYESKITSSFEEEKISLDTLEIINGSLTIKINTEIGKTYYVYFADSYNSSVYESDFTFKDLFFQIFDGDKNLIKNCYASEITYLDNIGGITILSPEPSSSFEASKNIYYINLTSFSGCSSGTIGFIVMDSNKNIIKYEVLTK